MPVFDDNPRRLDAFRRGRPKALEKVYFVYVDEVESLFRRGFVIEAHGSVKVPGVHDAEARRELVQEVFTRAFAPAARLAYDGVRPYRPYLLRIVKNILIDRLRRTGADRVNEDGICLDWDTLEQIEALIAEGQIPSIEPDPPAEESLHFRTLSSATSKYLETLNEKLQYFARLRFEEGHSQRAVAGKMHVTRRQVRNMEEKVQGGLRRYLKRLKLIES